MWSLSHAEAHHEVIYHVLHGDIVATSDKHIRNAKREIGAELRRVVTESEQTLDQLHR
eukprot:COSAG01_NODE_9170_length_2530_cov_2.035788_2_plen_58_part_00